MAKKGTVLSNSQVVALAISELGGTTKAIDIEDIAIRAFEITPEKFSWRKHPNRIDLRVIQYALKDAASTRKGNPLLKGSLKHGYMLTRLGLEWVEANQNINPVNLQDSSRRQSTTSKLSLEQARLLTSTAFQKFESDRFKEITYSDFEEFARINDYFPEHIREKRYVIIENAVHGNSELENLWALLIDKFIKGKAQND